MNWSQQTQCCWRFSLFDTNVSAMPLNKLDHLIKIYWAFVDGNKIGNNSVASTQFVVLASLLY